MDRLEKEFGIVANYNFEKEEKENKKTTVKVIIFEILAILATIVVGRVTYWFTHSFVMSVLVAWVVFCTLEEISKALV
jgi:hypothetical protein